MDDLEALVGRVKQDDLEAFAEVVRRFQHMAFGYAVALVRDLREAEDVVQEAFVAAWSGRTRLADPAAFPGWLRGIVRHQAHRVLRRRHLAGLPLDAADLVPAEEGTPDRRIERERRATAVLHAIARLPDPLREVVTLFYVHECTQQDIATFLGVPLTTVNNRLHAARTELKRRTLTMVKDTLETHRLPDDFAARIGRIINTQGGVVEARFDPTRLPDILEELTVSDDAQQRAVTVQVIQHREDGVVRALTTTTVEALPPGASVLSSGRRRKTPMSRETLDGAVRALARPSGEPGAPPELLETGIKVIDVMCPLVTGGTVAIAGEWRTGPTVVVEELVRRLCGKAGGVSLFSFIPPGPGIGPDVPFREAWDKEGYSNGTVGSVQTFYFPGESEWTPDRLAKLPAVDVVIRLSQQMARLGIYPTVDSLTSRSRLLEERLVSEEHVRTAARAREHLAAIAGEAGERVAETSDAELRRQRARKLLRFFAQPFYVAEPYTKRPGTTVPLAEALRACREILDGVHDHVPETAFYFVGGIDEVLRRAAEGIR